MNFPLRLALPLLALLGGTLLSGPLLAQERGRGPAAKTLDPLLEEVFAADLIPGMAVAVVRGDQVVYSRGFGVADVETGREVTADTGFYIASTTKSFFGTAAATLATRDELDLDAPLSKLARDFEWHPQVDASGITLLQLMSHTHGVSNDGPITFHMAYTGSHDAASARSWLKLHGPAERGRKFEYGNVGFNLAGMVTDSALGKGWKDVLSEELFEPIGMKSTSGYRSRLDGEQLAWPHAFDPDGFRRLPYVKGDANMHSAGGLISTANDLGRWLVVNLNAGKIDGTRVLPAEALAAAQAEHASAFETRRGPFHIDSYGLGWFRGEVHGQRFLSHGGGFTGFSCHLSYLPDSGLGIALLSNCGTGGAIADPLAGVIYGLMLEQEDADLQAAEALESMAGLGDQIRANVSADRERRAARPQELPRELTAYTGTYANEIWGELKLELVEGKLEARLGRLWSAVEVYDNEKELLRVELTGRGSVLGLEFAEGDDQARAVTFEDERFERRD